VSVKSLLRQVPGGGALIDFARNIRAEKIDSSADYWEARYREGGNSGAGSYGRLALFKAQFLNEFVRTKGVKSVLEFGSGDGAQLMLAEYPSYVGVDVSRTILAAAREKFRDRPDMRFLHASEYSSDVKAELVLSLDVIFHLVEDAVFEAYMRRLFNASLHYVIIYSSNDNRGFVAPHVRHRKFTRWVKRNAPGFTLLKREPNPFPEDAADPENTSFADFYVFERTSSNKG
jgi:predicted O-methyltransferase YrrM